MSAEEQQKAALAAWRASQPKREKSALKEEIGAGRKLMDVCPHCWRADGGLIYVSFSREPITCKICKFEKRRRMA